MKVTGFSFIKNAVKYDYPVVESINSILPVCDEFVIAVGKSEDGTRELIEGICNSKIRIIDTEWDESLREGGRVLALETDKAFKAISKDTDWAFYIQADEVVHEDDLQTIHDAMLKYKDDKRIDGLLFKYRHFYGSYDYVGASANWYKNEIRVVRNDNSIFSFRDAQGFRKGNNEKLKVVRINAFINHYGWVKEPAAMQRKQENFNKYWHDNKWIEENIVKAEEFDYARNVRELSLFKGNHPAVMTKRIKMKNWEFDHDISFSRKTFKDKAKELLSSVLGIEVGYRNYVVVKDR